MSPVKKAGRGALTYQPVRAEGQSRRTCVWKGLMDAVRGKFQSSTSFLRIFQKRSKACLLFACNGNRLKDHSLLMPFMIGLGWRPVIDQSQQWVTYRKGLYDVGLPFPSFSNASFNTLCTFSTDVNEVHPNTFTVKFRMESYGLLLEWEMLSCATNSAYGAENVVCFDSPLIILLELAGDANVRGLLLCRSGICNESSRFRWGNKELGRKSDTYEKRLLSSDVDW